MSGRKEKDQIEALQELRDEIHMSIAESSLPNNHAVSIIRRMIAHKIETLTTKEY